MSELPQGWAEARLEEIADINPRHSSTIDPTTIVSFVPMPAVSERTWQLDAHETRPFSEVRQGYTHFADGDVLFAKITPCMENGKGAIAQGLTNGLGCGSTELHVLRPLGGIDPRFLYYFLHQPALRDNAARNMTGSAGQLRVPVGYIKDAMIPLPPLPEQRRIVAKLEQVLARVDACRNQLEQVPTILKRYRQSVLAAACSGRLTEDWREEHTDIETATELFDGIQQQKQQRYEDECRRAIDIGKRSPKHSDKNKRSRNSVGELPELPTTWEYYRLEAICHQITDGTHVTPIYQSCGVTFLSVKNVRPFLTRDDDVKYISAAEHQSINARCNPEKGDILYTKVGATFGYAALVKHDYPFSIFVSLALIKPVTPILFKRVCRISHEF